MADFIVIKVNESQPGIIGDSRDNVYVQLLKTYDSLDRQGKVQVLTCAYTEKLRMSRNKEGLE